MIAKDLWPKLYCPYCHMTPDIRETALHPYTEEHIAAVKKFKRQAAYRNRQQEPPGFDSDPLPQGKRP